MQHDEQKHQTQQIEQVMTTIFTCRSIIRYNMSLIDKQKEDVLQDIDASLEVLRSFVLTNGAIQSRLPTLQSPQTDLAPTIHTNNETEHANLNAHEILQELYHMYHAYLDMNKHPNLQSFVSRFNEVISVLNDLQRLFEQDYQSHHVHFSSVQTDAATFSTAVENLLYKVKIFISDLYYVFTEFIRVLSSILQHNNVQLDTEKLTFSPERPGEKIPSVQLQGMQEPAESTQRIQEAYQQLRRRRLQMESRISEAAAFLEFLKETLRAMNVKMYKLSEILLQTDAISQLLAELIHIITDYEKFVAVLLSMHE